MKKAIFALGVASVIGCAHVVRNIASEVISKKTIMVRKINSEEELKSITEVSGGVIRQGFTIKPLLDNRDLAMTKYALTEIAKALNIRFRCDRIIYRNQHFAVRKAVC